MKSSLRLAVFVIHTVSMSHFIGMTGLILASCDMPEPIPNAISTPSHQTLSIGSYIIWKCREGYMMQAEANTALWVCLEDGSWLGQSPVCEVIECSSPPIAAYSSLDPPLAEAPFVNQTVTYNCSSVNYTLIGESSNRCLHNGTWENEPPICQRNCDTTNTNITRFSNLTCFRRHTDTQNWDDSFKLCEGEDEILATVKDAETQTFLVEFLQTFNSENDFWIGAMEGRDWKWRKSDKYIERFFWHEVFPASGLRDCIELSYHSDAGEYTWNPRSRGEDRGVLCQYNDPCQSAGLDQSDMVLEYIGNCFQFLDVSMNCAQGVDECNRLGGFLAEILDESTNTLLADRALYLRQEEIVADNAAWWIGGYDDNIERSWYWSDKTRVIYEAWDSSQPNNNGHGCIYMRRNYNSGWHDGDCSSRRRALCQIGIPACGDPGQPLHGYRLPDDRTTYSVGATLHFACEEGYELIGADILRCMNYGLWDRPRPSCQAVVCQDSPPLVVNASYEMMGSSYQDITVYTCQDGYIPNNEPVSFCQHNGTWSTYNLTCKALLLRTPEGTTSTYSSSLLSTKVEEKPTTDATTTENSGGAPPIVAIASGSAVALLVLVAVVIAIILIFRRLRLASPKETDHNLEDLTEHSYASNIHKQHKGGNKNNLVGVSSNTHNLTKHAYEQSIVNTPKDRSSMKTNDQDLPHTYEQPSLSNQIRDYNESSMDTDVVLGHTYMQSPVNDSTDNVVPEHSYLNKFDDDYFVPINDDDYLVPTGVGVESKTVYETVD